MRNSDQESEITNKISENYTEHIIWFPLRLALSWRGGLGAPVILGAMLAGE
jgi:hypothetical protein